MRGDKVTVFLGGRFVVLAPKGSQRRDRSASGEGYVHRNYALKRARLLNPETAVFVDGEEPE